jgi:hypothetical protein
MTQTLAVFNGKISVSQHAIDEAIRDFRVNPKVAEEWLRSNLRKASFISDIISESGNPCRLFGFQRIAFVLDASSDRVITVYPRHHAVNGLQTKVQALILRELRNAERRERSIERKVNVTKAQLTVERAECKLRMTITPSKAVVRVNTARIAEINAAMAELDRELFEAKKERSSIAKSAVMYV